MAVNEVRLGADSPDPKPRLEPAVQCQGLCPGDRGVTAAAPAGKLQIHYLDERVLIDARPVSQRFP